MERNALLAGGRILTPLNGTHHLGYADDGPTRIVSYRTINRHRHRSHASLGASPTTTTRAARCLSLTTSSPTRAGTFVVDAGGAVEQVVSGERSGDGERLKAEIDQLARVLSCSPNGLNAIKFTERSIIVRALVHAEPTFVVEDRSETSPCLSAKGRHNRAPDRSHWINLQAAGRT